MSAKLLKFTPKDRQGDPDFPGIPALAHFYQPPAFTVTPEAQAEIQTLDTNLPAAERLRKALEIARRLPEQSK